MSEHRAAVLDGGGLVVNVILLDPDGGYEPGGDLMLRQLDAADTVQAGDRWDGSSWTPAPAPGEEPPSAQEQIADLQTQVDALTLLLLEGRA